MSIRLGYAAVNCTLRKHDVITDRTCRLSTVKNKGIEYLIELTHKNIRDLFTIIKWNEKNNIKFYRMTSNLMPHIDNSLLLNALDKKNYKKLVYDISQFKKQLKEIGDYVNKHNHRITMHPDPYLTLGSGNNQTIINNYRVLFMHAKTLDLMNLSHNSTIIIHGGGVYDDKKKTIKLWVNNFNKLPMMIKQRIILENDEFSYSIQNVLDISKQIKPYDKYKNINCEYKLPIVFDYFHHICYSKKLEKNNGKPQKQLEYYLPLIKKSWGKRTIKMHLSEQNIEKRTGAHSDYVKTIPNILFMFAKKYNGLDLMIEAKAKELAVIYLKKKYKKKNIL